MCVRWLSQVGQACLLPASLHLARPLFQARGRQVHTVSGATIVSVRHTAARATRLVVSIHALSTVPCLASSSICLLLEYCIIALLPHCPIALSRADRVAGSTPQPTCHGVNIAQIAVDNQTPCTTSSMRRVTSTS